MRSPVGPWPLTMPTPSPASIRHVLGQNPRNWVNHFRRMDIRAPRYLNKGAISSWRPDRIGRLRSLDRALVVERTGVESWPCLAGRLVTLALKEY